MAIKLITFDLDDTLWDIDGVIQRAESATRKWLTTRVPEYAHLDPKAHDAIRRAVVKAEPHIVHDLSMFRETVIRTALKNQGVDDALADELARGALDTFLEWRHKVELFDDAMDVLETLARSYSLGVLTNGNACYKRLGLDCVFSFGFCSADVWASKPHPAMFKRALEHAGVQPGEAVHVGDHPEKDVEGAAGVGMKTVWLDRGDSRVDNRGDGRGNSRKDAEQVADATATINRLGDLPELIDSLDQP